jgi:predicted phage terminase large subunit-like protein
LPGSDLTIDQLRSTVKADLFVFCKWVLGFDKLDPDIHGPICRLLEKAMEPESDQRRLKVTIPRGWYKTTLVSIGYPIWCAVNNPNARILIVQNSTSNAQTKLRKIDDTFKKNDLFRSLFPEILPDKDCTWTQSSMCVKRPLAAAESTFEAAGIKSKLTSRHYDIIIEDDTMSPDLDQMGVDIVLPNKLDIEQAIGFHRNASPLLEHVMESRWIVVGTRWYEHDLLSWIDQNQPSFFSYTRAAREIIDGELKPTFPKRFDDKALDRIRDEDLGPYMFNCLYLNAPTRSEDMIFHKEWFQYWTELPPREELLFYTTVDPAGDPDLSKRKGGRKKTDWNVVCTTAISLERKRRYVVKVSKRKCNPGGLMDMLFTHLREYHPVKLGVESIAYQQSLDYWIRQKMENENLWVPIELLTHNNQNKNLRIQGLQPLVHSGDLLFHVSMTTLQAELESFPLAAHDDESDALAMHRELWPLTLGERHVEPRRKPTPMPDEIAELFRSAQSDNALNPHAEWEANGGSYAYDVLSTIE